MADTKAKKTEVKKLKQNEVKFFNKDHSFKQPEISIPANEPKDISADLNMVKEASQYVERGEETGFVNSSNGASMTLRKNGQINIVGSKYSQIRINPNGRISQYSMESVEKTNRKSIIADDIVINGHKLNPLLWEFTDMKETQVVGNEHAIVGNFTIAGSVLVKAWDLSLQRYVLIRRPCRIPMFGNLLNVPDIPKGLNIPSVFALKEDILALSKDGYQVNAEIKDSKSLIGKEGVIRGAEYGQAGDGYSGNSGMRGNINAGAGDGGAINPSDYSHIQFIEPRPISSAKLGITGDGTVSPQNMWNIAKQVGNSIGLNPEWIYAQWRLESGNFEKAANNHNYGGLKDGSGGWLSFDSPEAYGDYWGRYIRDGFPTALQAKDLKEYVYALCFDTSGAYEASTDNKTENANKYYQGILGCINSGHP